MASNATSSRQGNAEKLAPLLNFANKHRRYAYGYVKKLKKIKGIVPYAMHMFIADAKKVDELVYAIGDEKRNGRPRKFSLTSLTSFRYKF